MGDNSFHILNQLNINPRNDEELISILELIGRRNKSNFGVTIHLFPNSSFAELFGRSRWNIIDKEAVKRIIGDTNTDQRKFSRKKKR